MTHHTASVSMTLVALFALIMPSSSALAALAISGTTAPASPMGLVVE